MRVRLVAPLALMVLVAAVANGRRASAAGGDDPLAALDSGELNTHGDKKAVKTRPAPLAAMTPTRQATTTSTALPPQETREELPASYNAPSVFGMPAPPPPPASWPGSGGGPGGGMGGGSPTPGSGIWPTPPTAPTLPSVVAPSVPVWNFGNQ